MANVVHSTLTGANLHEPKGAATATSGMVYVADGLGSGTWTLKNALWTPYTPTITATGGTLGATSNKIGAYMLVGATVHFHAEATIVSNGDVGTTGAIQMGLPFVSCPTYTQVIIGRNSNALALNGNIAPSTLAVTITKYDNTYPGGAGVSLYISGTYQSL